MNTDKNNIILTLCPLCAHNRGLATHHDMIYDYCADCGQFTIGQFEVN